MNCKLGSKALPGAPKTYGEDFRQRVLATLEQPPPRGQAVWDGPAVAKAVGGPVLCRLARTSQGSRKESGPAPESYSLILDLPLLFLKA